MNQEHVSPAATQGDQRRPYLKPEFRHETGVRDHGTGLRQDQWYAISMQQPQERLLTEGCGRCESCARVSLAQETVQRFGRLRFRAMGSSMLPAIAAGDILTFRTATPGQLMPGQVVLVQGDDGRLVAHRLLFNAQGLLTTMGDSLRVPDAPLCITQLLGVLDAHERGARILPLDCDHRRLLPRTIRWVLRNIPLAHRIARRFPRLTSLTA